MGQEIRTVCPRNCYSTCGMIAHVKEDKLLKVAGDPKNKATCGMLCQKGYAYLEHVYHPDRLKYPMRRIGAKGGNRWERISWDEALQEIASRLHALKEQSEQNAVLFYQYSGSSGIMENIATSFWHLYGGCTGTYGSLCWGAGIEADRLTFGDNRHPAPWQLEQSSLIVVWGKNPARTNVHEMQHLYEAKKKGAKLVVIDPRNSETARQADMWIRPRPGTDAALALGLAHIINQEQFTDSEFLDKHTHGWAEFQASLMHYSPGKVAGITGVAEEKLFSLARMMGSIKPAAWVFGYGPQRFASGGQTVRAVSMLPIITGNIGKTGGGWHFANLQSFLKNGPVIPPVPDGMRTPVHIGSLASALEELGEPQIEFGWIQMANPAVCAPDAGRVIAGLMDLDFLVVSDLFLTDTAQCADLVLPAKSMFEQTDIVSSYWHPYLQIRDQCIPLYEEALPESVVFARLAELLHLEQKYFPQNEEDWLNELLQRNDPNLTLDQLRQGPVIPSWVNENGWDEGIFATYDGKIHIVSLEAEQVWGCDPLPTFNPVRNDSAESLRRPLLIMTPLPKQRIHSQFQNLPAMKRIQMEPKLEMHPVDANQRGIVTGSIVTVCNRKGSLTLPVDVTEDVLPGTVSLDKGWDHSSGANVNLLTREAKTDMGNGTAYHDCFVEVESSSAKRT